MPLELIFDMSPQNRIRQRLLLHVKGLYSLGKAVRFLVNWKQVAGLLVSSEEFALHEELEYKTMKKKVLMSELQMMKWMEL